MFNVILASLIYTSTNNSLRLVEMLLIGQLSAYVAYDSPAASCSQLWLDEL